MGSDAGKEPSERIVFLNDMRLQLQLGCQRHDLLLGDHGRGSRNSVSGTHRRRAVASTTLPCHSRWHMFTMAPQRGQWMRMTG